MIKHMMKDEEQKEHPGLKEMVETEIMEDLKFEKRDKNVIRNILKRVEAFCRESKWKKMVEIHKEVKMFERKTGED